MQRRELHRGDNKTLLPGKGGTAQARCYILMSRGIDSRARDTEMLGLVREVTMPGGREKPCPEILTPSNCGEVQGS